MKHFTTKSRLARAAMTLLVAMLAPLAMNAQETLTVHDGSATNSNVPIWGLWADNSLKSEMVYPATELEDMSGGTISVLAIYSNDTSNIPSTGSSNSSWNGTCQIFMKEVSGTTISDFTGTDGATIVYDGPISLVNGVMTIELSTPYTYGGGNLLVGYYYTSGGAYASVTWKGESVSNAAVYGRSGNSGNSYTVNAASFLPKTTFTYEPSSGVALPATFEATNVTAHEATLTWTGGTSTYNVEYKKKADTDWTPALANTSLTTHTLTGLTPNTDYQARVQSVGTNDVSGWRTINFKTPISCPAPTDLTVTLTPGNGSVATLSWTENGTATQWEICLNNDDENLRTVTSGQCSMANGQWSIELTGLTAEQAYTAKIRAVNSADDKSE